MVIGNVLVAMRYFEVNPRLRAILAVGELAVSVQRT